MATDFPGPDSALVGPQGIGTPVNVESYVKVSLTPVAVAAATAAEQSFTVTGVLASTDIVFIAATPAIGNSTAALGARATALNTVSVTFVNPTAGSLTPAAGNYTFGIVRLAYP